MVPSSYPMLAAQSLGGFEVHGELTTAPVLVAHCQGAVPVSYDERLQEEVYLEAPEEPPVQVEGRRLPRPPLPPPKAPPPPKLRGRRILAEVHPVDSPQASRTPSPVLCYDETLQERIYWAEALRQQDDPNDLVGTVVREGQPNLGARRSSVVSSASSCAGRQLSMLGTPRRSASRRRLVAEQDDEEEESVRPTESGQSMPELRNAQIMPVKHTFIHFDPEGPKNVLVGVPTGSNRSLSAPPSTTILEPNSEEAHMLGKCRPCAYFWYKEDGCRNADSCTFCHLCPRGEIQKKKKEKKAKRRAAREKMREIDQP